MRFSKAIFNAIFAMIATYLFCITASCNNKETSQRFVKNNSISKAGGPKQSEASADAINDPEKSDTPINITGVYLASYDNSKIRCDYSEEAQRNYKTHCTVVAKQSDGSELKALKIKDGVGLSWELPKKLSGNAQISECQAAKDSLSYSCRVLTEAGLNMAEVMFELKISEANKGERLESAHLILPYAVGVSGGFVPNIPFHYSGQTVESIAGDSKALQKIGFQPFSFQSNSVNFPHPISICMRDERVFFVYGSYIYQYKNGVTTHFAGSTLGSNVGNIASRSQIHLLPTAIACDKDAVYAASLFSCRIVKLTDDGPPEIIAGSASGECKWTPDGEIAKGSPQLALSAVTINSQSEVIFAELDGRIRKISKDGTLKTLGDLSPSAPSNDLDWNLPEIGGSQISSIAVNSKDEVYVADLLTHTVNKIAKDGTITKVAGTGAPRDNTNNDPRALNSPKFITFTKDDSLLIAEDFRGIKKLNQDGTFSQILSSSATIEQEFVQLGEDSMKQINDKYPSFSSFILTADGSTITTGPFGLIKFKPGVKIAEELVGSSKMTEPSCQNSLPADQHRFKSPDTLTYSADGKILVADFKSKSSDQFVIWEITKSEDTITRRGIYGCDNNALLQTPSTLLNGMNNIGGLTTAPDGTLYFANRKRHLILKIEKSGLIKIVAGTGKSESTGDGSLALRASVKSPTGLTFASDGTLYFAEFDDNDSRSKVRKISPTGIIYTVAGTGEAGDSGEGGPAKMAKIQAMALAVDRNNRLFIADFTSKKIKMIDQKGIISTIAGGGDKPVTDTALLATEHELTGPTSLAFTNDNTLYVVDFLSGILELKEKQQNQWSLSMLFGGKKWGECGTGRQSGKATVEGRENAIKNSLSTICQGVVIAITTKDNCPIKNGETKIAFTQMFNDYANIVEIVKPCQTSP